jgi:hypothetical protein
MAGDLSDFASAHLGRVDFMLVLDADSLMSTVYEARVREVWRLVHHEGVSVQRVAAGLKFSLGECDEHLAAEVVRRRSSEIRQVTFSFLNINLPKDDAI